MTSRRDFLVAAALASTMFLPPSGKAVFAQGLATHVRGATAVTEVFGNGLRLTAVAVEFDKQINGSSLSIADFTVKDRTIVNVYANTSPVPSGSGRSGRYVIIQLDPEDEAAALYVVEGRSEIRKDAVAEISWERAIKTTDGDTLEPNQLAIATSAVHNSVVDDFEQLSFSDPETGLTLEYNLFKPRDYDASQIYPLVLFMHDAGATSNIVKTTLIQGLGAVIWAHPEEQAKRPAFVLAPQYSQQVVNDRSEASPLMDVTVRLVEKVAGEFNIDRNRLYATGQSGGGMMAIAMNIKYPDLLTASLLVACQWSADLVAPLANEKLWIVVSEGDLKAYPGQNAITAKLEKEGATVNRAVWNGRWSAMELDRAYNPMVAEGAPVNYVALKKGTVVLPGQKDDGGSNHINTWRIAYDIEGLREWLFAQRK